MATFCPSLPLSFARLRFDPQFASQCRLPNLFRHPLSKSASLHTTVDHHPPVFPCHFHLLASIKSSSSHQQPVNEDNYLDETISQTLNSSSFPAKTLFWTVLWASVSLLAFAFAGTRNADASIAADTSIKASAFGRKVAIWLHRFGWVEEAIVFALATLPVIELRGAIPVGYWMHMNPWKLTAIAVIGNMVPVPLIVLFSKKFASFVAGRNLLMSRVVNWLFNRAKERAKPVEEFQWIGLMLFVAVPFPGTGAWTGAFIGSVLEMPFWSALTANFAGVVLAGLLVNLLVTIGLKYAIVTGLALFILSTFMWNILRNLKERNPSR